MNMPKISPNALGHPLVPQGLHPLNLAGSGFSEGNLNLKEMALGLAGISTPLSLFGKSSIFSPPALSPYVKRAETLASTKPFAMGGMDWGILSTAEGKLPSSGALSLPQGAQWALS